MDTTFNPVNALKELLAAGTAYREAEYAVRNASATKARKAVLARNEALERLHKAEAFARDALDNNK
jgi:hypothetical protein